MWDINLKLNKKIKELFSSVKVKLFLTLSLTILLIIIFIIIVNNFLLENFYLYSKQKSLKSVYETINKYYLNFSQNTNIEEELENISVKNNFDILIRDNNGINIYTTNKNFTSVIGTINDIIDKFNQGKEIESKNSIAVFNNSLLFVNFLLCNYSARIKIFYKKCADFLLKNKLSYADYQSFKKLKKFFKIAVLSLFLNG